MKYDSLNEFVESEYQYASYPFERQLPLPSTSRKIPYRDKDLRIIKVNNEKHQIDELRNQIQRKCDIEELHYQNKLKEMKKQNEYHRLVLQQRLKGTHGNIFDMPETQMSSRTKKRKYDKFRDSLDELKLNEDDDERVYDHRRVAVKTNSSRGSAHSMKEQSRKSGRSYRSQKELDSDEEKEKEKDAQSERLKLLDYVYKKNDRPTLSKRFISQPPKKEKEKIDDDRQNYLWVKRVREQKKRLNLSQIEEKSSPSQLSSDESLDSSQKQKK